MQSERLRFLKDSYSELGAMTDHVINELRAVLPEDEEDSEMWQSK
jgi:hypothetical protein